MRILKRNKSLILSAVIVLGIITLAALPKHNHQASKQKVTKTQRETEDNPGPIVDYDADYKTSSLIEPTDHEVRQARSSHYDKREPFPLSKFSAEMTQYARDIHWGWNISALPTAQSNLIVLGEVIDAKAYLSNDKSGVYSEFTIRIEDILKNNAAAPLDRNSLVIAEREGGVVRFESGRLLRYKVWHQGLPSINHKYVFFLQYNENGKDYFIVTGYKVRDGRVMPLDGQGEEEGAKLPFAVYKGFDKETFLNAVREAIVNPPHVPNAQKRWDQ